MDAFLSNLRDLHGEFLLFFRRNFGNSRCLTALKEALKQVELCEDLDGWVHLRLTRPGSFHDHFTLMGKTSTQMGGSPSFAQGFFIYCNKNSPKSSKKILPNLPKIAPKNLLLISTVSFNKNPPPMASRSSQRPIFARSWPRRSSEPPRPGAQERGAGRLGFVRHRC